jgi:hypothetical protein
MFRLALATLLVASGFAYAPPPRATEPVDTSKPNTNALLKTHKDKVTATASTQYDQWPASKLIDGDEETSWFSQSEDTATNKGTTPWVKVAFPADVTVKRVTILGNREPQFPKDYSVLAGKLELLDDKGKVLASKEVKAKGEKFDFDVAIGPMPNVRAIRFSITDDQGDKNGSKDCALAEIQVE